MSPCPTHLDYKLSAKFKRGRFRIDNELVWKQSLFIISYMAPIYRISTRIVYQPRTYPAVASTLRQVAYRQGTIPPSPKADPEGEWLVKTLSFASHLVPGWENLGTKTIVGTAFESRWAELFCTVRLSHVSIHEYGLNSNCSFILRDLSGTHSF